METKELLEKLQDIRKRNVVGWTGFGELRDISADGILDILEALIKRDADGQPKTDTGNPFINDAHALLMRIGKQGGIAHGTFLEQDVRDYYDRHKVQG